MPVSDGERWLFDRSCRERELAQEDRRLAVQEADLELRRKQAEQSGWRNPIVVAVFAAAVAAAGNAVVTAIQGQHERDLARENAEQERTLALYNAEQARILEMIRTGGDPDLAAGNLRFLLDAGLLQTQETVAGLHEFLRQRQAGQGPALGQRSAEPVGIVEEARAGALIVSSDGVTRPLERLSTVQDRERIMTDATGYVSILFPNGTNLHVGPDCVITIDHRYMDEELDLEVKEFTLTEITRCLTKEDLQRIRAIRAEFRRQLPQGDHSEAR